MEPRYTVFIVWLCFLGFSRLIAGDDSPFISKEKAFSVLHRVKRSMTSECFESGGCSYEEVRELVGGGRSRVCEAMREFRCQNNHCSSNHYCKTTNADCSNYNTYHASCVLCESEYSINHCLVKVKLNCHEKTCKTCENGYYVNSRSCSGIINTFDVT